MKEQTFEALNGDKLIVQYRKSAVTFLREVNQQNIYTNRFSGGVFYETSELNRTYTFDKSTFKALYDFLNEAAHAAWKNFVPKEANSMGSDHYEYYDRDFDNNGYSGVGVCSINLEGPNQEVTDNPVIRLYKFNKRKFESFMYDYESALAKVVQA